MTKKQIVETALKGVGMKRVEGESTEPIMPYLLADVMYQLYQKDVIPANLRHKMRYMHKMWIQKYSHFNKKIFTYFKPEEYTEITDLMDSVGDYLSNEITMLRSQIMMILLNIDSFQDKRVISTLLMCHIFAQYAECSYNKVYYKTKEMPFGIIEENSSCPELCYLSRLSHKMAIQYIRDIPGGDLELGKLDTSGIFNQIANKIYQWLKEN